MLDRLVIAVSAVLLMLCVMATSVMVYKESGFVLFLDVLCTGSIAVSILIVRSL